MVAKSAPPPNSLSSAIADFVMVLMFEVVDEINENIDEVVAYQTQAYREGHPTSSGI